MSAGLSIYDALVPFAGQNGSTMPEADFLALVTDLLQTARVMQVPLALRMPELSLEHISGRVFTAANEPPTAGAYILTSNDILVMDRFVVSQSAKLPVCLVARHVGTAYEVILTGDEPFIDMAYAILMQYQPDIAAPFFAPQAFTKGGETLMALAKQHGSEMIFSWASGVFSAAENDPLEAARHALGAAWCQWDDRSAGHKPSLTTQHQTMRVQIEAHTFEAVGHAHDPEFELRCYFIAGALSAMPIAAAAPVIKTMNFEGLDNLMEDWFGDFFQEQPELNPFQPLSAPPTQHVPPSPVPAATHISVKTPETQIEVPAVNLEVLSYINNEISYLRDRIMDAGLYKALADQPRTLLDQFISRSGDLVLLLDEIMYLHSMADQVEHDKQPLDPYELMGALVMTYSGEAERRGVDLLYDAPDDLPPFIGNVEAINRALVIMLEETINYIAPKGTAIIGASAAENHSLELFIRNDGAPLEKENITRLFMPRFVSENGGAPGLGFAALQPIVEAHHGRLIIERKDNLNHIAMSLPLKA